MNVGWREAMTDIVRSSDSRPSVLHGRPQPTLAGLSISSLHTVAERTPLLTGGGSMTLVGRALLHLVEKRWNMAAAADAAALR